MGNMNEHLEGYFDMSEEHPQNLSYNAGSITRLTGVDMDIPDHLIHGIGGGMGIDFDYSDENHLQAGSTDDFDIDMEDFSIFLWLARTSDGTARNYFVSKGDPINLGGYGYCIFIDNDNKIKATIQDDMFADAEVVGPVLPRYQWTAITMTFSATCFGQTKLYVNEDLVDTDSLFTASHTLSNNELFYMGLYSSGKNTYTGRGWIDTTMFFRGITLTTTQIIDLINMTRRGIL